MDDPNDAKVYELDSRSVSSIRTPIQSGASTPLQTQHPRTPQAGPYRLSTALSTAPAKAARGLLLAFEGLDRSGKSTQCALLAERLRDRGVKIAHLRFPDRTTAIGQLINAYLTGQSPLDDHAVHLLFSANRWEQAARIRALLAQGTTVLVDRYYYSGCVYSAAKEIPGLGLQWARHPDVGLPRPDLCVFLDVSAETASQRAGFGEEVYEKTELQAKVRELFEVLMQHPDEADDMVVVNADRGIDEVERTIGKWVGIVRERVTEHGLEVGSVRPW